MAERRWETQSPGAAPASTPWPAPEGAHRTLLHRKQPEPPT